MAYMGKGKKEDFLAGLGIKKTNFCSIWVRRRTRWEIEEAVKCEGEGDEERMRSL